MFGAIKGYFFGSQVDQSANTKESKPLKSDISNSNLDKALYDKMKGDFNRYIINIVNEEEKNQFYEESLGSYVKGIDRLKDYPYSEPIKLSLYLNYAVILFEEKDLKEDAFDCLNICIKQCRDLELNDEGIEILNLIKENYEVWKKDNKKKIKTIFN